MRSTLQSLPSLIASGLLALVLLVSDMSQAQMGVQSSVLKNKEVDAYVLQNSHLPHTKQAKAQAADPFSEPVAVPPSSLELLIETPFTQKLPEYEPGPKWKYNLAEKTLELRYFVESLVMMTPDWEGYEPKIDFYADTAAIDISRSKEEFSGGIRQNGFGVQVSVVTEMTTTRGIMARATKKGEKVRPGIDESTYLHTLIIDPEKAKALVSHLKVEIRAQAVPWRPGDFVQCASRYSAPTISNPRELVQASCYLSTEIIALRFVDDRDGTIIHEWMR